MVATILVVDDSEAARASVRRALEESELDLKVVEAEDGAEALSLALAGEIDIVVSDIVMPKLDGVQLLRAIRAQRTAEALPVILVTSQIDGDTRSNSFDAGASDYLTKPFLPAELVSRIQVQLRLRRLEDELKQATERFRTLGMHDELTGLANRRHFFDASRRELARSRRHQAPMSVAVMDIDAFRRVNSHVGYLVGDAIITEMSVLLGKSLRTTDLLARVGGEKFALLLPDTDTKKARAVSDRLCEAVRSHAFPGHGIGEITLSVGTATYPMGPIETVDELVNAAESTLDKAKALGGSRAELWDAAAEAEGH